jgi:uncharacterized membrane protein YbhN (UPF0104 family)
MSDSGADGRDELFGLGRRKVLIGLGVALALTLGATAVIGQVASYHRLLDAIRHASKAWLPLTLAGEAIAYLGYLLAYRSVAAADGGPRLRTRDAAQVIALGLGAYVVGSDAGGLTVDYWAMRQAGSPTHEAFRRMLALNTLQAFGLVTFAAVSGAAVLALGTSGTALVMAIAWLVVVPAAIAASALVSSDRLAPRLEDAPESKERPHGLPVRPWLGWLRTKLRKLFADVVGGLVFVRHVIAHPLRYLGGVTGFPLFWLGDFFILWTALVAYGVHLNPARLVLAEATAWVLTFLPLPGGGAGVAEAGMTYSLHAVGVPLPHALSAALTYRAVNFWLPLVPALLLVPRARRLQDSLHETHRTEEDSDAAIHPGETEDTESAA